MVLLTTGQAAGELGCAVTTFRRLVYAGLLPGISRRGVRSMIPLDVVQALRDRASAPLEKTAAREIAVLRVDSARRVQEDGRQWVGFSAELSPPDLLKALRGWWRCDPAGIAAGGVLPVTLSGYVVAVLSRLETWEKDSRGRHAFTGALLAGHVTDLASPAIHVNPEAGADRGTAELLLGTRLVSHSGGALAYVATGSAAAGRP